MRHDQFVVTCSQSGWRIDHGSRPIGEFRAFADALRLAIDEAHAHGHRKDAVSSVIVIDRRGRLSRMWASDSDSYPPAPAFARIS
jgi:hypothetical protein